MIARPYLTCEILPNGNLKIIADAEAKVWIAEERDRGRTDDDILWDGFEGYWNNGSYYPFDAGAGNPFVGLTAAPCIAESMDVLDDGTKLIEGRLWYCTHYELTSFVDNLLDDGFTIFNLAE